MPSKGKCLTLTVENISTYLGSRSRLPFKVKNLVQIKEVSEFSNNNFVFSLKTKSGSKFKYYFLKQAQAFNRRSLQQNKPIAVHPGRIRGEKDLIVLLSSLWSKQSVPKIYFYDAKNYILLQSDISVRGKLLIKEFEHNRVHPEIATTLGKYLGKLHASTYVTKTRIWLEPEWHRTMSWFFNDYLSFGARKLLGNKVVNKFYSDIKASGKSQIWGDPVYRNIYVKPKGKVSCVDFDHTLPFDPMIDVAMLLSHWVWMKLKSNSKVSKASDMFIGEFIKSYWTQWQTIRALDSSVSRKMSSRLSRWLGLYLISRTDGISGSYFRSQPKWEAQVRKLGVSLFTETRTKLSQPIIEKLDFI